MNCAEFQKVLPYIIETGGNADEEEHLRSCDVCADLVADLKYIAEQAKLLLPMRDPSPKVWDGIQETLEREGIVKPARARGRLLGPQRWGSVPKMGAAVTLLLISFSLYLYRRDAGPMPQAAPVAQATQPVAANIDDQQVIEAVAAVHPSLRPVYEDNLKQVNAYISDAERALRDDPDDEGARQHLLNAYDEKAMVYDMALSRSF